MREDSLCVSDESFYYINTDKFKMKVSSIIPRIWTLKISRDFEV